MASIFTVRDKLGNIIEIPALKGEDGKSGVYVGTGEMPDGYYVQIDPEGEAILPEITVDSVVTPNGENAVSGAAVANYVDSKMTVDDTVAADSTNPVSGVAVAAYVAEQLAAIADYEAVSF